MTDAELSAYQAAAYRVLTACEYSIEESYRVDGPSIVVPQALLDDARMVIERWNADHPADDDEPITQQGSGSDLEGSGADYTSWHPDYMAEVPAGVQVFEAGQWCDVPTTHRIMNPTYKYRIRTKETDQ